MDEGRNLPDDILLPYTPPPEEDAGYDNAPRRGYEQGRERLRPAPIPEPDDVDRDAGKAWAREAMERGNVVRYGADGGIYEVDPETGQVVGAMPTFYRRS